MTEGTYDDGYSDGYEKGQNDVGIDLDNLKTSIRGLLKDLQGILDDITYEVN